MVKGTGTKKSEIISGNIETYTDIWMYLEKENVCPAEF